MYVDKESKCVVLEKLKPHVTFLLLQGYSRKEYLNGKFLKSKMQTYKAVQGFVLPLYVYSFIPRSGNLL